MAKRTLVSPDVELGSEIVRSLDAAGFRLTVALWSLNDEAEEYELVMSTPLYDKEGQRQAYLKLLAALSHLDPRVVNRQRLRLLSQKDPLIRELRRKYAKTPSIEGSRLSGPIGEAYLDDAYVYRIK